MRLKVIAGFVVSTVLVAGLTGCNSVSKDKYAALQQENADLHGKVVDLEAKKTEMADAGSRQQQIQPIQIDPQQPNGPAVDKNFREPKTTNLDKSEKRFELAGDVAFTSGSAMLTPAAKKELDTFAKKIKGTYASRTIRVEGYTDSTPIKKAKGKYASNEALSQARAEAVRSYLLTKGISANRVEAVGYGAAKLKKTPAASRRVDVVVLAD